MKFLKKGDKKIAAEEWTSDETGHWHACLDEGCQEKLDFEAHTYVEHICEVCGAVDNEVIATLTIDNDVVAYLDFASAIDAIEDNASMKVYKDVTTDEKVNLSSDLTIDLGGNTWTSNSENGVNDVDGSVLTLKNGTLASTKSYGIYVKNSATINLEKDATIDIQIAKSGQCGIGVWSGSIVNFYGTVKTITTTAISGNGNAGEGGVVINIYDGAYLESQKDMAIYMPNTEELNIYGGTLKGATAVYVKAGTTTISGGTLIATADNTDFRHSNGGCYATGEALVVEACDYPGENPTVIITGGEFEVKENGGASQVGLYEYGGAEITHQFEEAID